MEIGALEGLSAGLPRAGATHSGAEMGTPQGDSGRAAAASKWSPRGGRGDILIPFLGALLVRRAVWESDRRSSRDRGPPEPPREAGRSRGFFTPVARVRGGGGAQRPRQKLSSRLPRRGNHAGPAGGKMKTRVFFAVKICEDRGPGGAEMGTPRGTREEQPPPHSGAPAVTGATS